MHPSVDELSVIEGGKAKNEQKKYANEGTNPRTAGVLLVRTKNGQRVTLMRPQCLGTLAQEPNTLAIVGSFCLITLHGAGAAVLDVHIANGRILEIHEGEEVKGVKIEKITIEHKVMGGGN